MGGGHVLRWFSGVSFLCGSGDTFRLEEKRDGKVSLPWCLSVKHLALCLGLYLGLTFSFLPQCLLVIQPLLLSFFFLIQLPSSQPWAASSHWDQHLLSFPTHCGLKEKCHCWSLCDQTNQGNTRQYRAKWNQTETGSNDNRLKKHAHVEKWQSFKSLWLSSI